MPLLGTVSCIAPNDNVDESDREKARQRALQTYASAQKAISQFSDLSDAADNYELVARNLIRMGEKERAIDVYAEARSLYNKLEKQEEEGLVYSRVAGIYSSIAGLDNKTRAAQNYQRALILFGAIGSISRQAGALRSLSSWQKCGLHHLEALS